MIKSMTGYGRCEMQSDRRVISVEIRSVNHRYCDISLHAARGYGFAEDRIKAFVRDRLQRGKIDIFVTVTAIGEPDMTVRINRPLAGEYCQKLEALSEELHVPGELRLEYLASLPDVMAIIPGVENEEEVIGEILTPLDRAVTDLETMREREGEQLARALLEEGDKIDTLLRAIEERAPLVTKEYAEKLQKRIKGLLQEQIALPEERLAQEVALFADKCGIEEEIKRLYSHSRQMRSLILTGQGREGKQLDFLAQEMNREANTIGSKANDIEITRLMLGIKQAVENIREQVQNIA